ncbi:unnamed protein product [Symbiodinium necroappetens]|uniref:Uncharacterized protein n=1 Tax=Symbiodinium necroappetens TaxID=1628268 RepID=A0A813CGU0_9DINO|nr:unnamed protein product [Symbiodinium necroappetens]
MNLPQCEGGLYWQPNIHYIPASIKFGDNGEVIVTGGPPENAKAGRFRPMKQQRERANRSSGSASWCLVGKSTAARSKIHVHPW